ncbi:MAG: cell division protein ZapA [Spirochaetota bacterium]
MEQAENYISFEILNERFTIKSSVSKDYYLSLVRYLDRRINEIRKKIPNLSYLKTVVFAALDIVDELMKARQTSIDEGIVKKLSDLSESLASVIGEGDETQKSEKTKTG